MNNYEKMIKVLTIFSNTFKGTNIVVGGSMAMYVHGFKVDPHDLDVEIENPNESTLSYHDFRNLYRCMGRRED
jgi:hypothetical protein